MAPSFLVAGSFINARRLYCYGGTVSTVDWRNDPYQAVAERIARRAGLAPPGRNIAGPLVRWADASAQAASQSEGAVSPEQGIVFNAQSHIENLELTLHQIDGLLPLPPETAEAAA